MHHVLLRITRRMWPELETMVPPDRRHGLANVLGVTVSQNLLALRHFP